MEKVYIIVREVDYETEIVSVYANKDLADKHLSLIYSENYDDETFTYFQDLDPGITQFNFKCVEMIERVIEDGDKLDVLCKKLKRLEENKGSLALEEKRRKEVEDLKQAVKRASDLALHYKNELINIMKKEGEEKKMLLDENTFLRLEVKQLKEHGIWGC